MGELELEMEMEAGETCWTKLAVVSELSLGGELGKDGGEGSSLGRQGPGFEKMEGLCKCGERERFQSYVRYVWNNLPSSLWTVMDFPELQLRCTFYREQDTDTFTLPYNYSTYGTYVP